MPNFYGQASRTLDPWPFPANWKVHLFFGVLYFVGANIHHNVSTAMSMGGKVNDAVGLYWLAHHVEGGLFALSGNEWPGTYFWPGGAFYLAAQLQMSLLLLVYGFVYRLRTYNEKMESPQRIGSYLVYYDYVYDTGEEPAGSVRAYLLTIVPLAILPVTIILNLLGYLMGSVGLAPHYDKFIWDVVYVLCGPNGKDWWAFAIGGWTPGIFSLFFVFVLPLLVLVPREAYAKYRYGRFKKIEVKRRPYSEYLEEQEFYKREATLFWAEFDRKEEEKREREERERKRQAEDARKWAEKAAARKASLLAELRALDLSQLEAHGSNEYTWVLPPIFRPLCYVGIGELNVTTLPNEPPEQRYNQRDQRWETIGQQQGPMRGFYVLSLEQQAYLCKAEVGSHSMRGSSSGDKVLYISDVYGTIYYLYNPVRHERYPLTVDWKHSEIADELNQEYFKVQQLLLSTFGQLMRGGHQIEGKNIWS